MPQQSAATFAISLLSFAFLLANVVVWGRVIARWVAGKPAIVFEPRRPVPWGPADAAVILAVWFVLMATLPLLCHRWLVGEAIAPDPSKIDNLRVSMLGTLLANLGSITLGAAWLAARGARPGDFGLTRREAWRDLRLGALAFVAAVVPVYAVQRVLVEFWPSKHPLVSLLEKSPDGWIIALAVLSAAIVAPIVEEFLFRLVLQGAIETAELRAVVGMGPATQAGDHASANRPQAGVNEFAETTGAADAGLGENLEPPGEFANPYRAPGADSDAPHAGPAAEDPRTLVRSLPDSKVWGLPMGVWPMTISATLFALLHAGHGPDPIPLLLLALIMGYLYRQTHRVLPSIVLHMALNSCGLLLLWLQLSGVLPE
jgi:membrane protease YdiL (CAAX protease family)